MGSSLCEQESIIGPKGSKRGEKSSRLSQNDKKWEFMKEDIRKFYVLEGSTLPRTMQLVQEKYGFQASPRKWKTKFKEWNYETRLTEMDMKIVSAKAEKRACDDGKKTDLFHNGILIHPSRIANFKKRNTVKNSEAASHTAEPPAYITYSTPRSESSSGPTASQDTEEDLETLDIAEEVDEQFDCSSSTLSSGANLTVDGILVSDPGTSASPVSASSGMSESSSSTSITICDRHEKEPGNIVSNPTQSNLNPILRIKSLQRIYSPLLFGRAGEKLHPNQQPDGRAITFTQTKAEVHVWRHEYDEAVVLYWKVVAGWRFLGNEEKRLEAQLTLGTLLEKQDRVADAFSLFMSTFIGSLDVALSLTFDSPQFLSLRSSVTRLRGAHTKANIVGKWSEVIDCLDSLEKGETASFLSHNEYLGPTPGFIHGPDVVKAAINLALAYSTIGEFGAAESIFKLVLNNTSESSRKRFNTLTLEDRAIANRDYAVHCHRRGNNLDCFSYLARALENCLEVHFPSIGAEVTNAIKKLLKLMNRQLIVDQESAGELAELKIQQVSVVISIISKTEAYKGNSRDSSIPNHVVHQA
ncbi:hypothetical protein BKA64DRAFT_634763 [Cadophora sp. MPI-SDFR-AT-0126]|nr:hypothetical protein BKA64DRAFT_634763 [Leotiomycetes sp. MPI-SDFR-AT-0126]